jgi:hypothetical protein
MAFLDALRRSLGGESTPKFSPREVEAAFLGVDPDTLPIAEETPFNASNFDRTQWSKKLKRVIEGLPETRAEWDDVVAESKALGFEADWVALRARDAFTLLVRRAVADRVVTDAEHRKIDLARDLIGLSDADAEAILQKVVEEAESFFGKSVEGT